MNIKRPISKQPIPENAQKVFKGKIFDVYQWQQELFDGSKTTFKKVRRTDTVNVLPITDDGKIILTEQEQPGMPSFIGVLGGRIDRDESPLEAAKRELMEEAGMEANEFVLWYAEQFLEKTDWAIYSFVAKGCKTLEEQKLDSGEKIKLIYLTFDEFLDIVARDNYRDWDVSLKVLKALKNPQESEMLRKFFMPI